MSLLSPQPDPALPLDLEPRPGQALGRKLTMISSDDRCAVLLGATPLYVWDEGDGPSQRLVMISLVRAGLLTNRAAAAAFALHENSVGRLVRRVDHEGLGVAVPAKVGRHKGATASTRAAREHITEAVARGMSGSQTRTWLQEEFGIALSLSSVHILLRQARPSAGEQIALVAEEADGNGAALTASEPVVEVEVEPGEQPATVSADAEAGDPDAVTTVVGSIVELPEMAQARYMGLALYFPALDAVGLLRAAAGSLRLRAAERFDLRAVMLTLFFLTLLRKSTLESAKHLRRLEFGAVVGSGRAPCVKTLRRKLDELGEQGQAGAFGQALARHWVETGVVGTAYLYVDGHMKVYSGKRPLQKVWNAQRRMPLPGIESYVVSDQDGHPLLLVTEEVSPSLSQSLPAVVRQVREVIGDRPLTLIFDRGGFDGKLFSWLRAEAIDFITYQRGGVDLPVTAFTRKEVRFEGKRRRMQLAEDTRKVSRSGPWRRIVVRNKDGHQTPILTSITTLPAARIACLMFARWRQENLFKYLRQHHGLDTLVGTRTFDAGSQLIPNPECKRLTQEIALKKAEVRAIHARLGAADATGAPTSDPEWSDAVKRIEALETEIVEATLLRRIAPPTITVAEAGHARVVFNLERKVIVDQVKLAAYNAEEWLLDRLLPHYRNTNDVRDLLRSFAELSGSIHTTDAAVEVTLDPPDTPLNRSALRGLCDALNQVDARFPGTSLPVRYAVRVHHSAKAA